MSQFVTSHSARDLPHVIQAISANLERTLMKKRFLGMKDKRIAAIVRECGID